MNIVQRGNFDVVLNFYVDVILVELRREMQMRGIWVDDLQCLADGFSTLELHSATIRGLQRMSLDGWPSAIKLSPEHLCITIALLLHDVYFEASYEYTTTSQMVSGETSGRIGTVSLDVVISHPAGPRAAPEVISFNVTKYTRVRLSESNVSVLNEKIIQAIGKALHVCVQKATWNHVLPVLSDLLKTVEFPNFT